MRWQSLWGLAFDAGLVEGGFERWLVVRGYCCFLLIITRNETKQQKWMKSFFVDLYFWLERPGAGSGVDRLVNRVFAPVFCCYVAASWGWDSVSYRRAHFWELNKGVTLGASPVYQDWWAAEIGRLLIGPGRALLEPNLGECSIV